MTLSETMRLIFLLALVLFSVRNVSATQPADSIISTDTETETLSFRPRQLIIPGSMIAVGTFGVYNGFCRKIDRSIKKRMDRMRGDHYFKLDNYIRFAPVVAYLGLDYVGVKAKHTFKERMLVGATAYLAMGVIVEGTKGAVREKRPDTEERNSFPSGHTATAFTGAELVREEYGLGVGVAAYTVATGVAFLRLYNGRHWLNDVIAGAGVGILSARIGYWMLPLYRRWFGLNRRDPGSALVIVPSYCHNERGLSLNLAYNF